MPITIDDVIKAFRDIMKEYISSSDKIEKLQNFVCSVEEEMGKELDRDGK
jgi:hypothetical protein